jgi:hypothetical protein
VDRVIVPLLAWALAGCGAASGSRLPDYSEWLRVGVDPAAEASALTRVLEGAGYRIERRIDTSAWIAIEARRDERRAIRVVTARGTALALDSHEDHGLALRHGEIELVPPAIDLDGDGRDEIVVGARAGDRLCLLPFRADDEGGIAPEAPDVSRLGDDVCVESFRDVGGDARPEGIAVVRARRVARETMPTVEAPLARDPSGGLRAGPPPVAWLAAERARRSAELDRALRSPDPEAVYRVAIELALLARIAGEGRDAQLEAFDGAIGRGVWTEDLAGAVRESRGFIERGWSDEAREAAAPSPQPLPRAGGEP